MKVIKNISLVLSQGSADEVFEMDLLEIGPGKYLVNHRSGKMGAGLKIVSATKSPVNEEAAHGIFEAIIAEKLNAGYKHALTSVKEDLKPSTAKTSGSLVNRLNQALQPGTSIRRSERLHLIHCVGEERCVDAKSIILDHIYRARDTEKYALLRALSRIAGEDVLPQVRAILKATDSPAHVVRLAKWTEWHLAPGNERFEIANAIHRDFYPPLLNAIREMDMQALSGVLSTQLGLGVSWDDFESLVLVWNDHEEIRDVLAKQLAFLDGGTETFSVLLHLLQLSIIRDDSFFLGALATCFARLEATTFFRREVKRGGIGRTSPGSRILRKAGSKRVFHTASPRHLLRMLMQALFTRGKVSSSAYASIAAQVLVQSGTRESNEQTAAITSGNWDQYEMKHPSGVWKVRLRQKRVLHDSPHNFIALWKQQPNLLLWVLAECKNISVHQFILPVLTAHPQAESLMTPVLALALLDSPLPATIRFAVQHFEKKYDPDKPDTELLYELLHHSAGDARGLALRIMLAKPEYYALQSSLLIDLVVNKHDDITSGIPALMEHIRKDESQALALLEGCVSALLGLSGYSNIEENERIAVRAIALLRANFQDQLQSLAPGTVRNMEGHKLNVISEFGKSLSQIGQ